MNKYEQLIEHIINDETDKARALFHNIVVEKSRDIYESLVGGDDLNEIGGNQVQGLRNEVTMDEQGISEEEDEFAGDDTENDFDQDDAGDEFGGDEFGDADGDGDESAPATKGDLNNAMDDLLAEFHAIMDGETDGDADDEFGGEIDGDADDEFGAEDAGSQFGAENDNEENDNKENEFGESIVREYVEKVGTVNRTGEGQEVGKGGTASVNKTTPQAGKNDMGGSAKNLNQGKSDGSFPNAPQKASNYGTKGQGTVPVASRNMNVPGGKAGSAFKSKESVNRAGEGQTTDGKVTTTSKSVIESRKAR